MKRISFLFAVILLSRFAIAGGGQVGNGGYALVCRDSKNSITEAQTLDLFEGKELWKKTYNGKVLQVFSKLNSFPTFRDTLKKNISDTDKMVKFVSNEFELLSTEDAFPIIVKKGCKYEQLANYTEDGELLISREIYEKLSSLDKSAFLIHESLYALFRKAGATDSRDARRLTAELLATNPDQDIIDAILQKWLGEKEEVVPVSDYRVLSCAVKNVLYYLDDPTPVSISIDLVKKEMSATALERHCIGSETIGKLQVSPTSFIGSFRCEQNDFTVVTIDRVTGSIRMKYDRQFEQTADVGFCKEVQTIF